MQLAENVVVGGKFRLNRLLGRGGMGSVWYATHLALDIPCAVKFIEGDFAAVPEMQARFQREAKAAAALRSPHVVQILDHDIWEGMPYIAMELLDGEELSKRVTRLGRIPPAELNAIAQAAEARASEARIAAGKADAAAQAAQQNVLAAQSVVASTVPLATSHRAGDDATAQQADFRVTAAQSALQQAQMQEALAQQSASANIALPATAPGALPLPNPLASMAQMQVQNAHAAVQSAQQVLTMAQQAAAAARQSGGVNLSSDNSSARDAQLGLQTAQSLAASATAAAAAADANADNLAAEADRARAAASAAASHT